MCLNTNVIMTVSLALETQTPIVAQAASTTHLSDSMTTLLTVIVTKVTIHRSRPIIAFPITTTLVIMNVQHVNVTAQIPVSPASKVQSLIQITLDLANVRTDSMLIPMLGTVRGYAQKAAFLASLTTQIPVLHVTRDMFFRPTTLLHHQNVSLWKKRVQNSVPYAMRMLHSLALNAKMDTDLLKKLTLA